ncbi:aminoacyl-tRNA hydrolase [Myxococcota bacterium]|nr:aminoacyl-tRNA hydrolase [Myxococcota bacterium]
MSEVKQVIVIRRDLKMRRGKEIAQGAHASMAFLSRRIRRALEGEAHALAFTEAELAWIRGPFAKVCVRVNSEEELRAIHAKALEAGLTSELIIDSGRTEFGGVPTPTACAVGPDEVAKVDAITGALELY